MKNLSREHAGSRHVHSSGRFITSGKRDVTTVQKGGQYRSASSFRPGVGARLCLVLDCARWHCQVRSWRPRARVCPASAAASAACFRAPARRTSRSPGRRAWSATLPMRLSLIVQWLRSPARCLCGTITWRQPAARRPQICLKDLQGLCGKLWPSNKLGRYALCRSMFHKCDEPSCGGYLCHECFLEDAERCAGCREVFCGTQSCGLAGGIPTCDRCDRAWCGPCVTSGAADPESRFFAGLRSHEFRIPGALPDCDFCERDLCVGVWVAIWPAPLCWGFVSHVRRNDIVIVMFFEVFCQQCLRLF